MILSICIPTYNRPQYLRETIESILRDGVDFGEYEIVVSDNSDNGETENLVRSYASRGGNFVYYANPSRGFYNSIVALRLGSGEFLKLHNDYTSFRPGEFSKFVESIKMFASHRPLVLYTNGNLRGHKVSCFDNFDDFLSASGYWNTWSSAFSIWRDDLRVVLNEVAIDDLNDQFPHTSLLFELSRKGGFVIDDRCIFENLNVTKKGGYNIFYNFAVVYVGMLQGLRDRGAIGDRTYEEIKSRLKVEFFPRWHSLCVGDSMVRGDYSFDNTGLKESILRNYSLNEYREMLVRSVGYTIARRVRDFLRLLVR